MTESPVRICCGRRHSGAVCLDGKVMCCLRFNRVDQADLAFEGGERVNVCIPCADEVRLTVNR